MPGSDQERAQNPREVLRNYNQDVHRSLGDVAEFEGSETVGYGGPDGHALFHQADLEVFQEIPRSSFENLTHSRCARFCRVNCHVQIKSGSLKDDLAAGSQTASFLRGRMLPAVKNKGGDKSRVIEHIFDDLELEYSGPRAIVKFENVLIKHWPKWITSDFCDQGGMTRVEMGIPRKNEDGVVWFET